MKVITEERLRDLAEDCSPMFIRAFKWLLKVEFKEIDTLTVSKLRPMCDAPKDGLSILCVLFGSNKFIDMFFDDGSWVSEETETIYNDGHIKGWIPMPIYQPELTGDSE